MRVLFCGDRNWTDPGSIYIDMCDLPLDTVIVTGGAKGADTIACDTAERLGLTVEVFEAQWDVWGRAAGPMRNTKMLDSGIDKVFAYHNNLSESKGTKNCVSQAIKRGIEVFVLGKSLGSFQLDHFNGK